MNMRQVIKLIEIGTFCFLDRYKVDFSIKVVVTSHILRDKISIVRS